MLFVGCGQHIKEREREEGGLMYKTEGIMQKGRLRVRESPFCYFINLTWQVGLYFYDRDCVIHGDN